MNSDESIEAFLSGDSFAVVGASRNRSKYGNMVLRCYQQHGRSVTPVNPQADVVEGVAAVASLSELDSPVHGISIITPPDITTDVVREAIKLDIRHIWMQPGAESSTAIAEANDAGLNLIHSGPCLLVVLGFRNAF